MQWKFVDLNILTVINVLVKIKYLDQKQTLCFQELWEMTLKIHIKVFSSNNVFFPCLFVGNDCIL